MAEISFLMKDKHKLFYMEARNTQTFVLFLLILDAEQRCVCLWKQTMQEALCYYSKKKMLPECSPISGYFKFFV